jgi:hypothetical protein
MNSKLVIALVMVLAISSVIKAPAQPYADTTQSLTVSELLANADRLTNQPVVVRGILRNRGANYFTDLRLVLESEVGSPRAEIPVVPWLPTEFPRRPTDIEPAQPTLADYLAKKVLIRGTLVEDVLKNFGRTRALRVVSVRVAE